MYEFIKRNLSTGRIEEIIEVLQAYFKVNTLQEISASTKLEILCYVLQLDLEDFDNLIINNPQVLRTITGHSFETVMDKLWKSNNIEYNIIGGDSEIDRGVNGFSLQLKTPYKKGTTKKAVSYKTHKTHGPKSQKESQDYYSKVSEFADYLLGLVSYSPFTVVLINKNELPTFQDNPNYIESPFKYDLITCKTKNDFSLIGISNFSIPDNFFTIDPSKELLPKTTKKLGLNTDIVVDTILQPSNFRIWDMNIRGFARESALNKLLDSYDIEHLDPKTVLTQRADKTDLVLKDLTNANIKLQVKGITLRGTDFCGQKSIIDVETQLSRGRVNDHETQSRLYKTTDFDYLIIALDPVYSMRLNKEINLPSVYEWQFYYIPQKLLKPHATYTNRINSHQKFKYTDLQQYKIDSTWLLTNFKKKEDVK